MVQHLRIYWVENKKTRQAVIPNDDQYQARLKAILDRADTAGIVHVLDEAEALTNDLEWAESRTPIPGNAELTAMLRERLDLKVAERRGEISVETYRAESKRLSTKIREHHLDRSVK